jgi:hypothetical protein
MTILSSSMSKYVISNVEGDSITKSTIFLEHLKVKLRSLAEVYLLQTLEMF